MEMEMIRLTDEQQAKATEIYEKIGILFHDQSIGVCLSALGIASATLFFSIANDLGIESAEREVVRYFDRINLCMSEVKKEINATAN